MVLVLYAFPWVGKPLYFMMYYMSPAFDAPYYQSGVLGDLKAAVFSVITPAVFWPFLLSSWSLTIHLIVLFKARDLLQPQTLILTVDS